MGAIMVEARPKAKQAIFGSTSDNIKYAKGVKDELKKMGHFVELVYCSRSKIIIQAWCKNQYSECTYYT